MSQFNNDFRCWLVIIRSIKDEDLRMYQIDNNSDKQNKINARLLNSLIVVSLTALFLLFIVFGYKKDKTRLISRIDGLEMEVRTLNWDRKKAISEKNEIKAALENEILEARSVADSYKSGLAAIKKLLIKQGFSDFEAEQFLSDSDKTRNEIITQKTNKQLPTDNRLDNGTILQDISEANSQGKLTITNDGKRDAFVKLIRNNKAVASFYVRASSEFVYTGIPHKIYQVAYCVGYDWDDRRKDFNPNRYRSAKIFSESISYVIDELGRFYNHSYTLSSKLGGNAEANEIPLSEFQNY